MDFSSGALLSTPVPFSMHLYTRITNKHDNLIQIGLSPRFTVNIFRLSVKRNIKKSYRRSRCRRERERERGGINSNSYRSILVYEADREKRGGGGRRILSTTITCTYTYIYIHPHTREPYISIGGSKFRAEISREEVRIADCRVRRQHWKRFETVSTRNKNAMTNCERNRERERWNSGRTTILTNSQREKAVTEVEDKGWRGGGKKKKKKTRLEARFGTFRVQRGKRW